MKTTGVFISDQKRQWPLTNDTIDSVDLDDAVSRFFYQSIFKIKSYLSIKLLISYVRDVTELVNASQGFRLSSTKADETSRYWKNELVIVNCWMARQLSHVPIPRNINSYQLMFSEFDWNFKQGQKLRSRSNRNQSTYHYTKQLYNVPRVFYPNWSNIKLLILMNALSKFLGVYPTKNQIHLVVSRNQQLIVSDFISYFFCGLDVVIFLKNFPQWD